MKVKITTITTRTEIIDFKGTLSELHKSISTLNEFGKKENKLYNFNVLDEKEFNIDKLRTLHKEFTELLNREDNTNSKLMKQNYSESQKTKLKEMIEILEDKQ